MCWGHGEGETKATVRLRERVTSGSSALEVIQARFWALLSACLSEWHLDGTYSSQLSWVFPKSDGIKEGQRQAAWLGLGEVVCSQTLRQRARTVDRRLESEFHRKQK